ncbi:PcfJ domain-containing protein [Niveibacterium terrae]|uniref:PcfJ domain-containing protein n=1 Tax=Niveibacterium terrae TaxID=3373598 RepID=UPI003A8DFC18
MTATKPAYAGRNALNAAELRSVIDARSAVRGDPQAIRAWLLNHFWRHWVANFEPAQPIATLEDAQRLMPGASLPDWLFKRLEAPQACDSAPLVWLDPAEPAALLLEARLVEFLSSRQGTSLDGKLARINCPQALSLWEKEHDQMQARLDRGWRQSDERALRTLLEVPEGRFVEFLADSPLLRAEMAYESYLMRHCVGQFSNRKALTGGYGEQYAQAIEQGKLRIISLRDRNGQPHITISLTMRGNAAPRVDQVKGKQNRPPISRYVDALIRVLNLIGTDMETPNDCLNIGIVRTETGWQRLEEIADPLVQARFVSRYPHTFSMLRSPGALAQWITAARQPAVLDGQDLGSAALRYALRGRPETESPPRFFTNDVPWPGYEPDSGSAAPEAA